MIGWVTDTPRRDLELDHRSPRVPISLANRGAFLPEIGCQPCILHLNHLRSVEIFVLYDIMISIPLQLKKMTF